jgi:hypothetical protein
MELIHIFGQIWAMIFFSKGDTFKIQKNYLAYVKYVDLGIVCLLIVALWPFKSKKFYNLVVSPILYKDRLTQHTTGQLGLYAFFELVLNDDGRRSMCPMVKKRMSRAARDMRFGLLRASFATLGPSSPAQVNRGARRVGQLSG